MIVQLTEWMESRDRSEYLGYWVVDTWVMAGYSVGRVPQIQVYTTANVSKLLLVCRKGVTYSVL